MTEGGEEHALHLDAADELAPFRQEFHLGESIYLDGNSLGLLSRRAEKTLSETMVGWKERGIAGWTEGRRPWFYMAEEVGAMTAPLVGASPEEVVAAGSTTVNVHQLLATFYRPEGRRTKILATQLDFPSDIHALDSQLRLRGLDPEKHLVRVGSRDGRTIEEEDIVTAMTDDVALVFLPTALYRSGQCSTRSGLPARRGRGASPSASTPLIRWARSRTFSLPGAWTSPCGAGTNISTAVLARRRDCT